MPSRMLFIWIGALLFIGGLLFTAAQAIRQGRLSVPRQSRPGGSGTLEPPPGERSGGFGFKANWPGLALIALGAILLLAGAAV